MTWWGDVLMGRVLGLRRRRILLGAYFSAAPAHINHLECADFLLSAAASRHRIDRPLSRYLYLRREHEHTHPHQKLFMLINRVATVPC
ncbi:hypothetical protein BD779DRAFT_527431 [Infundibulicybe gibba]|nr:hypothetical protein BD779DRAFT_527431 [Infundibulicybe gibba]